MLNALAVAIIRSRNRPGAWVVGACCRETRTGFAIIPPSPMRGADAEWLAIHDHEMQCGQCDLGTLRAHILAERTN